MPRRPNDLNPRQQRFVAEFLVDLNATQAALRTGYRHSKQAGARLMATPHVIAAVIKSMERRNEKTGIDAEWVLRELYEVHQRSIQAIRPALHPKHRTQMRDEDGNLLFTYDATAALRALELIAKHVDVDAFAANRVKVDADASLVEILQAGRKRAGLDDAGNRPVIDITPESASKPKPEPKVLRKPTAKRPGNPEFRPTPHPIPVAAPSQVQHEYDPYKE